jgi:hypothetical protein
VDEGAEGGGGGATVHIGDTRQKELVVVVGGPTLEYAPYEDLRESHGEALMRTLEDGEGHGSGGGGACRGGTSMRSIARPPATCLV